MKENVTNNLRHKVETTLGCGDYAEHLRDGPLPGAFTIGQSRLVSSTSPPRSHAHTFVDLPCTCAAQQDLLREVAGVGIALTRTNEGRFRGERLKICRHFLRQETHLKQRCSLYEQRLISHRWSEGEPFMGPNVRISWISDRLRRYGGESMCGPMGTGLQACPSSLREHHRAHVGRGRALREGRKQETSSCVHQFISLVGMTNTDRIRCASVLASCRSPSGSR
jgi:hypothetical protein